MGNLGALGAVAVDVTARLEPLAAGLKQAESMTRAAGGRLATAGSGIAGAFGITPGGVGLAAVAAGLWKAVQGASNLNETLAKTREVFGGATGAVTAQADQMAKRFGLSKTAMLDAASSLGLITKGAGLTEGAAAKLANELTMLAADASSFYNTSLEEALHKIRSGLVGESEPLRAFGVLLNEDAVKAEALRLGLARGGGALSESAKVMARSALITRQLGTATGDLARTEEGFANQQRTVWGRLGNMLTDFGAAISPVSDRVIHGFNTMMIAVQGWVDAAAPRIKSFSESFLEFADYVRWALGQVGEAFAGHLNDLAALGAEYGVTAAATKALNDAWAWLKSTAQEIFTTIGVVFRNWSLIVGEATLRAVGWITNAGEIMAWLGDAAGQFLAWFGRNWQALFIDAIQASYVALQNLATNAQSAFQSIADGFAGKGWHFDWTPMLEGFKATVEKLPALAKPALSSVQDQIDAMRAKMLAAETKHVEDAAAAAKAVKPEEKPAAKAKAGVTPPGRPAPTTKAEFVGFADFAKKIQLGALGKDDFAKRSAVAGEAAAATLKKIDEKTPVPVPAAGPAAAVAAGPE